MRATATLWVLLAAGCTSTGASPAEQPPDRPAAPPGETPETSAERVALGPGLMPLTASSTDFAFDPGRTIRKVTVEPGADGASADFYIDEPGTPRRKIMSVTRQGDSLYFSASPGRGTELLRAGARPGDAWESDDRRITFDGWERVAGFDAARITARSGPKTVEQIETWWFAPNVGLVRLRNDHGGLFVEELVRTSP